LKVSLSMGKGSKLNVLKSLRTKSEMPEKGRNESEPQTKPAPCNKRALWTWAIVLYYLEISMRQT